MTNPNETPGHVEYGTSGSDQRLLPSLTAGQWLTFTLLAALLAAANIYTTLLIGWGDTGSIVAVLASVLLLGVIGHKKPTVHVLNIGQTMASAGGSVGFAVASYAAVYIVRDDFRPSAPVLVAMFTTMGLLGAMVGSSVRRYMVRYFFPSGTACAVIQTSVARVVAPGERNRPVWMLKVWGLVAAVLTIPVKITLAGEGGRGIIRDLTLSASRGVGIGADPLYYGIGLVVGPRVGLGMLIGALAVPFLITDGLAGTALEVETGDWVKWLAIAVLTLPTFAAILFAYHFKTPAVIPPGFEPGRTQYAAPAQRAFVFGMVGALAALGIALTAQQVFALPWHISLITIIIAWPLCIVNGRVTGDTDINPVRLVAIVLLSGFFWMIDDSGGAIAMLGMAVVGGTLASVAVDMMQDYRTGFLVDANPTHQTTVQFIGALAGSLAAIPVLNMLLGELGIGPGSSLPAPGAQVWATMAQAMAGGFHPSGELVTAIIVASLGFSIYAFLTVWPKTAPWMPSVFGIGIGMLVGVPASAAIFLGGVLKWIITLWYTRGKSGAERDEARTEAGNDSMLAGASVFAAAAILSIVIVLVLTVFKAFEMEPFHMAH